MTPIQPQKDLADIASRLQQIFRQTRAFKKMHQLTNIDLSKQSSANLLDLYRKLRTVYGLSEAMQEAINNEKTRPQDALTPAELEFYKIIIASPLILNHASPAAPTIINSGSLYSLKELRRPGMEKIISIKKETLTDCVLRYGPGELKERQELVQLLLARQEDIQAKYDAFHPTFL